MSTVTGVSATDELPDPDGRKPLAADRAPTGRFGDRLFGGAATVAGVLVIAMVSLIAVFLIVQAVPALTNNSANFFTSRVWAPGGDQPAFGIVEFLWTTVIASTIAMFLAVPVGVAVALFLTQYAPRWMRRPAAALVDLLAAVPSIVYGLWGALVLVPYLDGLFGWLNDFFGWTGVFSWDEGAPRSMLTVGILLAIMILPIITNVSREVFRQVPQMHEEAALALGATRWEVVRIAVIPFGRSGVISASMLGLGRALGETMAVATVLSPDFDIHASLLNPGGGTFAQNIASKFNEATEFGRDALIASGLVLFVITLLVNGAARMIIARRKEYSGANA